MSDDLVDQPQGSSAAFDAARFEQAAREGRETRVQGDPEAAFNALAKLTAANAAELRSRLAWLNPVPLGRQTSFGFGDRLGLATPGHLAAVKGTGVAPIFAQQSVRENERTGAQDSIDQKSFGLRLVVELHAS